MASDHQWCVEEETSGDLMKRSEALIPLSHEHHHALFQAKLLRDADEVAPAIAVFREFWEKEGALHFRIEEEVLLPGSGLDGPSSDEQVARLHDEHLQIRRQVGRVLAGDASLEYLGELGEALTAHVRFEERDLFPRIEAGLDAEQLAGLAERLKLAEEEG